MTDSQLSNIYEFMTRDYKYVIILHFCNHNFHVYLRKIVLTVKTVILSNGLGPPNVDLVSCLHQTKSQNVEISARRSLMLNKRVIVEILYEISRELEKLIKCQDAELYS